MAYNSYSGSGSAAPDLRAGLSVVDLDWAALVGQRSLSRLRANLLNLGHRNGHRTRAAEQTCIACPALADNLGVHCLVSCPFFQQWRTPLVDFFGGMQWTRQELTVVLLGLRPGHPAYIQVVQLAAQIEKTEKKFWSGV